MRKQYKEIFYEIKAEDELFLSVLNTRKTSSSKRVFVAAAACVAVCAFAFCIHFINDSETADSSIDIPIAYETKLQTEAQKHIGKQIKTKKGFIEIDADVIIEGNIKDLKIYSASVKRFSVESLMGILYGENGLYYGDKSNSGIFTTELGGMTFDVSIDLDKKTKRISNGSDYAEGCSFSYADARLIADAFSEKNNMKDFIFKEGRIEKSFSPFYGNWRSGFYIFDYVQYADGFLVETVSSDVESSVASGLTVKIDDEGIVGLNMFGLDLIEKKSVYDDVVTVETAINIIENNIENLWLSEYAPIVEIRLEYILDKNDDNSLELVPCWHFCIDQSELKTLDIQTQRENDTNDLCVNAITGEIYRVADRYPVYQTADGVINTWNK